MAPTNQFVRIILVACLGAALAGCDALLPTEPSSGAPRLSSCGATPNYVSAVALHRFRGFPVSVRVGGVFAGTSGEATIYTPAVNMAVDAWRQATGGLVNLSWAYFQNSEAADLKVFFIGPDDPIGPNGTAAGVTNYTVDANGIVQSPVIQLRHWRQNIERSPSPPRETIVSTAAVLAHEIGHALAIEGHSPYDGDLMMNGGNYSVLEEQRVVITSRDVNTMKEAYCR